MLPAPHIDGRSVPAMYQRGLTLIPCSLKYPSWSATANCEDICASRTSQASTSASSGFWAAATPAPARTTSVASTMVRYRIAAPFGAQQHHVDAQQARRDPHEHRKEGRVRDEGDLRRLAETEPDEEHRQERERRNRAQELDEGLDGEPRGRVERDGEAERQRGG